MAKSFGRGNASPKCPAVSKPGNFLFCWQSASFEQLINQRVGGGFGVGGWNQGAEKSLNAFSYFPERSKEEAMQGEVLLLEIWAARNLRAV